MNMTLWVNYDSDTGLWYAVVENTPVNRARMILYYKTTKKEAVKAAQTIGRVMECELFIRGKDGQIKDRRSYGNDPKGRG